MRPRSAAFFDRDGVLNVDTGYPARIADIVWTDDATEAVKACNARGVLVFVVTNQSGIARGLFDEPSLWALHRQMCDWLAARAAHIDDIRYCPHLAEGSVAAYAHACNCRKPAPGMILDLMRAWSVDPAGSFLVGDKEADIEAARAAGIAGYRFTGGSLMGFVAPLLDRHAA